MSEQFQEGDYVRLQLGPDLRTFRYYHNLDDNTWYDRCGTSGNGTWWDAKVEWVDDTSYYKMSVLCDVNGEVHCFHIPLPGHPTWLDELVHLKGWPQPPRLRPPQIPKCDCGCEKVYGDVGVHAEWCSKKQHAVPWNIKC